MTCGILAIMIQGPLRRYIGRLGRAEGCRMLNIWGFRYEILEAWGELLGPGHSALELR